MNIESLDKFTAYLTEGDELLTIHSYAGYTVLVLVVVRVAWGFIGTRHARFSDFVRKPVEVGCYVLDVVNLNPRRYLGHNPAGGLMIVIMIISLLVTTLSGIAVYAAEDQAPAHWLAGWAASAMSGKGSLKSCMSSVRTSLCFWWCM